MAPHTIDINRENNKFNSTTSNLTNNTININNTDIHLPTNNSYQSTTLQATLTTIGSSTTNEILFQQQQHQQSYYQQPINNTELFGGNYNNNNNQTQFDINLNSVVYLPQATSNTQFLSNNSIDYSPYSTGNTTTPSPLTTTFENINYIEEEEGDDNDYSSELEEKNYNNIMINGTNTFNNKLINTMSSKFNMPQYDDESCSQNQFADLFTQSQINQNNLMHESNYQQFDNYSTVKQEPMGYDDYNNYAHYQQQQQQQYQQQMPLTGGHQQAQQQPTTKSGKSNRKREEVKYGPIVVRPRVQAAPTLLTGRKSKYIQLTPDEERKREVRRSRNRAAAEKCKKKRLEIEDQLNRTLHTLKENQKSLTREFEQLTRQRNQLQSLVDRVKSTCNAAANNNNNAAYQQQQYQQPPMNYYNSNMYSSSCN